MPCCGRVLDAQARACFLELSSAAVGSFIRFRLDVANESPLNHVDICRTSAVVHPRPGEARPFCLVSENRVVTLENSVECEGWPEHQWPVGDPRRRGCPWTTQPQPERGYDKTMGRRCRAVPG